jgi:hypothetical protein
MNLVAALQPLDGRAALVNVAAHDKAKRGSLAARAFAHHDSHLA